MVLQNYLFPSPEQHSIITMYIRPSCDSVKIDAASIFLHKGESVSFDTYFNSFSVGRWLKYTKIENLCLNLIMEGSADIKLYKGTGHRDQKKLDNIYRNFADKSNIKEFSNEITKCLSCDISEVKTECKVIGNRQEYSISLTDFSENDIIYPVITAEDDCKISGLCWNTSIEEKSLNTVKLAAGICTYKREDFIKRNVSMLKTELIENKDSPLYGKLEIYIADNGQTLPETIFESDRIHIFPNKNLGGSAGFTRTIIEALINDSQKDFTHIILMDDDIELPVSTIERMYTLLTLTKDEYRDSLLGGAMLTLQEKTIQIENGAEFIGQRHHIMNGRYFNFADFKACCANYSSEPVNYTGWCCCCCPRSVLKNGLPLPLFIHFDDIEYGVRNNNDNIILMNGISIWHPAFVGKGALFYGYYDFRNLLITQCVTGIQTEDPFREFSFGRFFDTLMFDPISFNLIIMAMQDFTKGTDYFIKQDALALQNKITKDKYKYMQLSELEGKIIPDKKYFKKMRIARILHLLLLFIPSKNEVKVIKKDSLNDYPFRSRYIFLLNEDGKTGTVIAWRRHFLWKLLKALYVRASARRKFPKIKNEWQNAKKIVTSLDFWKTYLGI